MSDPEDTHDLDVCPNEGCRAIEAVENGRCTACGFGVCVVCLSEPVKIDQDGRCIELCGGTLTGEMG